MTEVKIGKGSVLVGFGFWLHGRLHLTDAAGYLAGWFFNRETGQWRKGRKVKVDLHNESASYFSVISEKASKASSEALLSCFVTAFDEYECDSGVAEDLPGKTTEEDACAPDHLDLEVRDTDTARLVNVRSIIGQLTRTVKSPQENDSAHSEEHIDVIKYPDDVPIAHVRVDLKHTKNLGNWESVSANYSLSLPCFMPEIQAAFDFAEEYVSKRMISALAQMCGENIELPGKREIKFTEPCEREIRVAGGGKDEAAKEESPTPVAGAEDGQADEVASEPDSSSDVTWESSFDPEKDDVGF